MCTNILRYDSIYSINVQRRCFNMAGNETAIQQILISNNGIVTTTQVTEAGIPRRCLSAMVESGAIYRVTRGIYALPDAWEDELFFICLLYTSDAADDLLCVDLGGRRI